MICKSNLSKLKAMVSMDRLVETSLAHIKCWACCASVKKYSINTFNTSTITYRNMKISLPSINIYKKLPISNTIGTIFEKKISFKIEDVLLVFGQQSIVFTIKGRSYQNPGSEELKI